MVDVARHNLILFILLGLNTLFFSVIPNTAVAGTIPNNLCLKTPPVRTMHVATGKAFSTALRNAKAGDHIILADGLKLKGNYVLDESGYFGRAIIIRSATGGGAILLGRLSVRGSFVRVSGLTVEGGSIDVYGNKVRISRNYIKDGKKNPAVRLLGGAARNRVDHNEIFNMSSQGIQLKLAKDDPIRSIENRIDHNYFHDFASGRMTKGEALEIGDKNDMSDVVTRTRIDHNLFQRINIDDEVMTLKSSGNLVSYNTFESSEGFISNRHGRNNVFRANVFDKIDKGLRVHGDGTLVIANVFFNSPLTAMSGNITQASVKSSRFGFPAARSSNFSCNQVTGADIGVGYGYAGSTVTAKRTRLDNNEGNIRYYMNARAKVVQKAKCEMYGQPKQLITPQVGVAARDIHCGSD